MVHYNARVAPAHCHAIVRGNWFVLAMCVALPVPSPSRKLHRGQGEIHGEAERWARLDVTWRSSCENFYGGAERRDVIPRFTDTGFEFRNYERRVAASSFLSAFQSSVQLARNWLFAISTMNIPLFPMPEARFLVKIGNHFDMYFEAQK